MAASSVQVDTPGWIRVAATASAPILALILGIELTLPLYLGVSVVVAATTTTEHRHVTSLIDTVMAAVLVVVHGGIVNPYLVLLLVIIGCAGARLGPGGGLAVGGVIAGAQVGVLAGAGRLVDLDPEALVPLLAIAPLTGLTGALAMRVLESRSSGRSVLERANRLLVDLQRISDEIPGGLDVATVAHATLAEVRVAASGSPVGLYVGRGEVLHPVASTPSPTPPAAIHVPVLRNVVGPRTFRLLTDASAAAVIGDDLAAEAAYWSFTPLRQRDALIGVILTGHPDVTSARALQQELVTLADDAAIAVDNAQLFDGTRTRAVDRARRQIAHDLHDSVAQALAHIRMELELLTLQVEDDPGLSDETERLSRVAGRALEEVRATIAGLRSRAVEDELSASLAAHVDDLAGLRSSHITLDVVGDAQVPAPAREHVLRLAQEAISNAVRHARAEEITVTLELDDEVVQLVVEDDGRGIGRLAAVRPGHGVGLRAMRDRAVALGGTLTIRDRVGGGTVVRLVAPLSGATEERVRVPEGFEREARA